MLIPVLEMKLNDGPKTFEVTLAEGIYGIGNAGDSVHLQLNPSEIDVTLGAGTPAAAAAKTLIRRTPYAMSGTVRLDPEDARAMQEALDKLALAAPKPTLSVQSITDSTLCHCGHQKRLHDDMLDEYCTVPYCSCREFSL